MKLVVLVLCFVLASCSANKNKTKDIQTPYITDAISIQILKAANPSPHEGEIRISASSKDLDERWYYNQCFQKIVDASKGSSSVPRGVVRVWYTVGLEGSLINAGISESSGYPELDRHLLSLIWNSEPFPKLPDSISLRAHKVHLVQTISLSRESK
jgi:TonB family protein